MTSKSFPDRYQQEALRTWPPVTHHTHLDMRASVMGLAGESGELCDDIKKLYYKPGASMSNEKLIEELGDVWYYLRIVAYQLGVTIEDLTNLNREKLSGGKHGWPEVSEDG